MLVKFASFGAAGPSVMDCGSLFVLAARERAEGGKAKSRRGLPCSDNCNYWR
jgi:hypothetical protein